MAAGGGVVYRKPLALAVSPAPDCRDLPVPLGSVRRRAEAASFPLPLPAKPRKPPAPWHHPAVSSRDPPGQHPAPTASHPSLPGMRIPRAQVGGTKPSGCSWEWGWDSEPSLVWDLPRVGTSPGPRARTASVPVRCRVGRGHARPRERSHAKACQLLPRSWEGIPLGKRAGTHPHPIPSQQALHSWSWHRPGAECPPEGGDATRDPLGMAGWQRERGDSSGGLCASIALARCPPGTLPSRKVLCHPAVPPPSGTSQTIVPPRRPLVPAATASLLAALQRPRKAHF